MGDAATTLRKAVIERVLHGPGKSSGDQRRAAFDNDGVHASAKPLIDKVSKNAWKVTSEDVQAAKTGGLHEDEIFELTISAALGQSTRQLDAALAALDAATKETP